MRLDVHLSEVEFRRVVAGPLANGRHTRDAVEVIVDGESLALGYDGAPLDVEHVKQMPTARWFEAGTVSPIVCTCGDPACTDFTATVTRHDDRVEWRLWDGRKVVFDGTAAATSLSDALND